MIIRISIILLLAAALGQCCSGQQMQPAATSAHQGVIDLSTRDLSSAPATLNGEWLFFWHRLLESSKTDSTVSPSFIAFPSLWKNDSVEGKRITPQGYASYRLTVLLPHQRPALALEVPDVYASYALYANDRLVAKNGQPGKSAQTARPFWTTQVVQLPDMPDTISLVLEVANFWHAKGGTYKPILIGDQSQLQLKYQRDIGFDLVLSGCLFMGGLFFLGLYLFGRHDKAILYFSLFCMIYSYRLAGTDIYVLHSLFPDLSWFLTIRLEYLSLCLGVALFGKYTEYLYPEDTHPFAIRILMVCCAFFALIVLGTPTLVFTRALTFFLALMFGYTGYASYVYLQAARHRRNGSVYALSGTIAMMVIFLFLNLHYFNIVPAMKAIVFSGYIAFFFLQSLALSQRFALTHRKAVTQAEEGLKIKSEFLSTMSHEIRTPLNAVIGMTHLLLTGKPREDQKKNLRVLFFSANNLLSIVNNILDYNKIEAGKISFEEIPFDLAGICNHIAEGLKTNAAEKNISLQVRIDEKLQRKVIGDPTRTGQVINNLVHNAIKFTEQGFVRLSLEVTGHDAGTITVTIRVEDTGIGIPAEKQGLIFDRFTQADSSTSRSFGGTGLGLAITKKILEMQGVAICVDSMPGKGSAFYFTQTFPLSSEPAGIEKNGQEQFSDDHRRLQGVCVLLVEDNVLNILVAQTILEKNGATVDIANNGKEALEKYKSWKHQIILMDLNMPVMDGYEATRLLRQRGETLPVIALTASMPKEVESEAYAAGITDIVIKPFDPLDLYRVILRYVQPVNS